MGEIAAQYQQDQWQEAVKEAEADVANAPNWHAEKSFRWHLSNLLAFGQIEGFTLPPPPQD